MTLLLLAAALQLVDQCGSVADPRAVAEVVVTGVIESDTLVRRPVPMRRDPEVLLQLRKLRLRVENVLLGDVAPGRLEVYYFTFWPGPAGALGEGLAAHLVAAAGWGRAADDLRWRGWVHAVPCLRGAPGVSNGGGTID